MSAEEIQTEAQPEPIQAEEEEIEPEEEEELGEEDTETPAQPETPSVNQKYETPLKTTV